jgi:uncharacterized protein YbjT (DUF2867 family)
MLSQALPGNSQQTQDAEEAEPMTTYPILVIGKKAKTGRRVAERLQHQNVRVRAVSRSTDPAFDWQIPETWGTCLAGVKSVYVTYQPDLAVPQADEDIARFIDFSKQAGVEHIVLLSGRGEPGAQRAERQLMSSGLDWNVVRANWFFQNFSESFMLDGILAGELVLPVGDTPEPFVDAEDIADVVVKVLTHANLRNRLFEVSGPRAMSFEACMQELSGILGRPVKLTQVPIDAYIHALDEQGIPEQMQWLLRELFTVVLDGRNSQTVPGIEEVLGRPPRDYQAYLRETHSTGIWTP